MVWAGAIIAIIGLITGIYKVFIDPRRRALKEAADEGKKAVDDRDRSKLNASIGRLRRK